jgi:hypothetical protein
VPRRREKNRVVAARAAPCDASTHNTATLGQLTAFGSVVSSELDASLRECDRRAVSAHHEARPVGTSQATAS